MTPDPKQEPRPAGRGRPASITPEAALAARAMYPGSWDDAAAYAKVSRQALRRAVEAAGGDPAEPRHLELRATVVTRWNKFQEAVHEAAAAGVGQRELAADLNTSTRRIADFLRSPKPNELAVEHDMELS